MRAQEFVRRQLREDIENFPIANVRRANGAIGTQGVNTGQAADVLTHAAGMQVSPDMTMRQLVDALKSDPAAQQRLRQFVQKNPITVSALPDGSYHLLDGHHRTFLLNLLGDETVPAVVKEGVAEGKVKLYTDPSYFGAEVDDTGFDSLAIVDIPANQLVGFEPDAKMNQPKSRANVEKIVAGLKQGAKLPPLLVRKYKNGYQVLDGHHRFWAYKLLGVKSIPAQIVPAEDVEEIGQQGVAEGKQPGQPVVDAILKVMPIAQEIWFHGSRATGKHRKNSDTDILVVVPDDLVGDQYLGVVRILQKLSSHFDNYDIQPTHPGYNIHLIAQEEGQLLWSNKQGVAENFADGKNPEDQIRDKLNAWMNQDQQYEDPSQRAGFQAKVWPYIQQNIKTILADTGEKGNGDYPAAPYAAWLLVQHMDAYPQNQIEFYNALEQAIPNHPKIQFLRDRAAVNQWIIKNSNNPEYFIKGKPLPNPTVNVRNPAIFKDAGIVATSREEALANAEQAGNKLLVAAVNATNAQTQPSYKQSANENFADGKNPGRKGLAKRSGVNTKASVSSLRKTAKNSSGEKQRMAHWLANMKAGRAKAKRK